MTRDDMLKAVKNNDENYDGIFFYAVKSTNIYCRPSCKSKMPKEENICFFSCAEDAKKAGFRPCKRCRSDLLDYKPMKEIAKEIKEKIEKIYYLQSELSTKLNEVGYSGRRLSDIFKSEYGLTPKAYADFLRLKEASRLLVDTDTKIIDIAYMVGFNSISSFYRFFTSQMKITPTEYRKEGIKNE